MKKLKLNRASISVLLLTSSIFAEASGVEDFKFLTGTPPSLIIKTDSFRRVPVIDLLNQISYQNGIEVLANPSFVDAPEFSKIISMKPMEGPYADILERILKSSGISAVYLADKNKLILKPASIELDEIKKRMSESAMLKFLPRNSDDSKKLVEPAQKFTSVDNKPQAELDIQTQAIRAPIIKNTISNASTISEIQQGQVASLVAQSQPLASQVKANQAPLTSSVSSIKVLGQSEPTSNTLTPPNFSQKLQTYPAPSAATTDAAALTLTPQSGLPQAPVQAPASAQGQVIPSVIAPVIAGSSFTPSPAKMTPIVSAQPVSAPPTSSQYLVTAGSSLAPIFPPQGLKQSSSQGSSGGLTSASPASLPNAIGSQTPIDLNKASRSSIEPISQSSWDLRAGGESVRVALMRWSKRAGWNLVWDLDGPDVFVQREQILTGDFLEATEKIIESMRKRDASIDAVAYKGNKTLRVYSRPGFEAFPR